MQIRRLLPEDAAAYRDLRLRALKDFPQAFTSSFEEDSKLDVDNAAARLGAPDSRFWGAWDGDTLVGMAGLQRGRRAKERHRGTVLGMFVQPAAAGRGVGAHLLQALVQEAARSGLELLVLTVTAGNGAAERLYLRCGFRPFGVEPGAVKVAGERLDKIHMVLEL